VRTTVTETMADGATTYVGGELHRGPIGHGATTLTFGGEARQVIPAPMGDLVAARRMTGASHITAYTVVRRPSGESYAYAEITEDDGTTHAAELRTGEGFEYTAKVATETAMRLLNDTPKPGAWTPCHLFGIDIVTSLPGTEITGR
jgi:saccharopine dehydrogenase (NAD+, L-lysine-forming)